MALLDISLVTQILIDFLEKYFEESPVWSGNSPKVLPKPPDKIDETALGLYLYHISEDNQYKNLQSPGNDTIPVRYVPMGLNLYYQLSAHSTWSVDGDNYVDQQMLGIALKAFHDYPFIDDSTRVNGMTILDPGVNDLLGPGNKLRIVLQPVTHNEAIGYWNNSSSPPRLSAYYQVSVVLLEPEEITSRAGRVLEYGVHTFIQGAPRLESSRNTIEFTTPGGTGRKIELRPAQVPVHNRVSFTGTGLTGDSIFLLLKNNRWENPVEVDSVSAWQVAVTRDKIEAAVQENAYGNVILPGIYAALVKVIRRSTPRDGSTRDFEHLSNDCPFTITPRIDSTSLAVNVVTVDGYIFEHTELKEGAVQVYLGENRLTLDEDGTLDPGEFEVVNPLQLRFKLPAGLDPGFYPLRIFVNGAESPPNWIEVP